MQKAQTQSAMLTPQELAERWKIPVRLLATWRYEGRGPSFTKIEGAVRYRLADIEEYEQSRARGTAS